jgi:hypothetical protein
MPPSITDLRLQEESDAVSALRFARETRARAELAWQRDNFNLLASAYAWLKEFIWRIRIATR